MEDASLRLDFHRAMDAVTPPAPWMRTRIREELYRRRRESLLDRARRRPGEFAWLLPAIAVLLAIAIIVVLVIGRRLPLPPLIPSRPHSGAAVGCPTWGYIPGGPNEPSSLKMFSVDVGWAPGALRTTDGGSDWKDVTPKDLRSGAPYLPGQQTVYPPNYSDFFLDANHAWLVRSYQSDSACVDHLAVYRTGDGGASWHRADIDAKNASNPVLSFLDPQHGWLLVTVPNPVTKATPSPGRSATQTTHTAVYRTSDGGQTWHEISSAGPSCNGVVFISTTRGFATGSDWRFNNCPILQATSDGGATWTTTMTSGSIGSVTFFDPSHAVVIVNTGDGSQINTSSDGGRTWSQTTSASGPFGAYLPEVWFGGPHDFWAFTNPPGWGKGSPGTPTDWLYHSADSGATWQLVQRDTPVGYVVSASFVDPSHAFVLQTDANGAIQLLTTSDGGHTWTPRQVHVT